MTDKPPLRRRLSDHRGGPSAGSDDKGMIESVAIRYFKQFSHQEVDLTPVSVPAGPNISLLRLWGYRGPGFRAGGAEQQRNGSFRSSI